LSNDELEHLQAEIPALEEIAQIASAQLTAKRERMRELLAGTEQVAAGGETEQPPAPGARRRGHLWVIGGIAAFGAMVNRWVTGHPWPAVIATGAAALTIGTAAIVTDGVIGDPPRDRPSVNGAPPMRTPPGSPAPTPAPSPEPSPSPTAAPAPSPTPSPSAEPTAGPTEPGEPTTTDPTEPTVTEEPMTRPPPDDGPDQPPPDPPPGPPQSKPCLVDLDLPIVDIELLCPRSSTGDVQ
jgi:hypothetical protein